MNYMQLGLSFVAITLLALVARWLFPVRERLNEERVVRNFERCHPGLAHQGPVIAADGKAALVPLTHNSEELGLVTQLGDRAVCRLLTAADIAGVDRKPAGLHIRFHDFTYPDIEFTASPKTLDDVHNLLKPLAMEVLENAA